MNISRVYKHIGLAIVVAVVMTACEGIGRIQLYAQFGDPAPTMQDYKDAGVVGIDSDAKLAEINQVVEGLVAKDVDTTEEIQALVDALGYTAPTITLSGSNPMNIAQNSVYIEPGAIATDDMDGTVVVTSLNTKDTTTSPSYDGTHTSQSGSTVVTNINHTITMTVTGVVDTSILGSYSIVYTAIDSSGNTSTKTRTVNVVALSYTHNGISYGTVVSPYTGKVWLDRNIGAEQICTSFDDRACYGNYYQWGRKSDGHQYPSSAVVAGQAIDVNNAGSNFLIGSSDWASVDDTGTLRSLNWSKTDGSSVCPVGFRVPTAKELKIETLDHGAIDRDTAFANFLKLPAAGIRDGSNGAIHLVGLWSTMWTNSIGGFYSYYTYFNTSNSGSQVGYRASAYPIRCIKD